MISRELLELVSVLYNRRISFQDTLGLMAEADRLNLDKLKRKCEARQSTRAPSADNGKRGEYALAGLWQVSMIDVDVVREMLDGYTPWDFKFKNYPHIRIDAKKQSFDSFDPKHPDLAVFDGSQQSFLKHRHELTGLLTWSLREDRYFHPLAYINIEAFDAPGFMKPKQTSVTGFVCDYKRAPPGSVVFLNSEFQERFR